MFAFIEISGRQVKVSEGKTFEVFRIKGKKGEKVEFEPVSFYDGKNLLVDKKDLEKVKVVCEIMGEKKGEKIYSFKKKPKTGYKKGIGHRDKLMVFKVDKIVTPNDTK